MWTIPQVELAQFRGTDREECGIVIIAKEKVAIIPVRNVANSNEDYAILMSDFQKVERSLIGHEKILGFFHTHLAHQAPHPSDRDYEGAELFPEFTNFVYHPTTGSLSWYGCLTEEPIDVGRQAVNPISLPQSAKRRSDESDVAMSPLYLPSHI